MSTTAAVGLSSRPLRAFGSLAANRALLRVLAAHLMFTLTECAGHVAMVSHPDAVADLIKTATASVAA